MAVADLQTTVLRLQVTVLRVEVHIPEVVAVAIAADQAVVVQVVAQVGVADLVTEDNGVFKENRILTINKLLKT